MNYCFLTGANLWFVGAVNSYTYESEHMYVAPDTTKYVVMCVKRESSENAFAVWNNLKSDMIQTDVKFITL